MNARHATLVGLGLLTMLVTGCCGSRNRIRFDSVDYPISLTSSVPDRDGTNLSENEMEFVGRLHAEGRGWSLGWTFIPIANPDFSEEINRQVLDAGGEAVVNLKVSANDVALPNGVGLLFLHWLPFYPGSVYVAIEGDIIRAKQDPAAAETAVLERSELADASPEAEI